MELDITRFFAVADPFQYSASRMELGQNAANITWDHARADASDYNLLNDDESRDAMRAHIKGFGAWDEAEIAAMSDQDLNALLIQMISGDMREGGLDSDPTLADWAAYEDAATSGNVGGRINRGDNGRIYYYIGD